MTLVTPETGRARRRPTAMEAAKERLRLWLRLLRASRGMEAELRERLRVTYAITLPQFDVLAALARRSDQLTMTELSRYLMVSNGNVTGIVNRLVEDGWIERAMAPGDRRTTLVRLTLRGAQEFAAMAAVHETWVDELLSDFGRADTAALIAQLDGLVRRVGGPEPGRRILRKGGPRKGGPRKGGETR